MYENYEGLYPIDTDKLFEEEFRLSDYMIDFAGNRTYMALGNGMAGFAAPLYPYEYTGWRDEQLSWQFTCAFSNNINLGPTYIVKGSDSATILKKYMINNFDKFPIGTSKFALSCVENGDVSGWGVIMKTDVNTYETHWLNSVPQWFAQEKEPIDAEVTDITGTNFVFQLMGPRSLEIIEEVTRDDLHDILYCHFRDSAVDGRKIRVLRFGMTNGLEYEFHGDISDAQYIYRRIIEVGNAYGIRRLGLNAYMTAHTPGGCQQNEFLFNNGFMMYPPNMLKGSVGDNIEKRYRNPFELGLGHVIDFNHDFIGKEALQAYKADPKRTEVTLEWNAEDISDIYESQFRDEIPYQPIDKIGPMDVGGDSANGSSMDLVFNKNGNEIGISGARVVSYYHRAMISLASIDLQYADLGTEVIVLWGDPGTRQKEVRAKVAPRPYNNKINNRNFDVEQIPRYKA